MCVCNMRALPKKKKNVNRETDDCRLPNAHIPGRVFYNMSEGVGISFVSKKKKKKYTKKKTHYY